MTDVALDDRDSIDLVVDEAYGRVAAPDWLRVNLPTWRALLIQAVKHADEQLTTLNAEIDEWRAVRRDPGVFRQGMAPLTMRRSRVTHFKRKVEARLVSVNAALREQGRAMQETSGDPAAALARAARLWQDQRGPGDAQRSMFAVAAVDAWNQRQNGELP